MLHGAGIFTNICPQKWTSFVGKEITAPWFALMGYMTSSKGKYLKPQN
jgi:hypothetical protein